MKENIKLQVNTYTITKRSGMQRYVRTIKSKEDIALKVMEIFRQQRPLNVAIGLSEMGTKLCIYEITNKERFLWSIE